MTGESATAIYVMACVVGFVVGVLMAIRKHDSEATCKGVTLRLPVPDHVPEPPDRPFVMPPQVVVMSADSGILDRTVVMGPPCTLTHRGESVLCHAWSPGVAARAERNGGPPPVVRVWVDQGRAAEVYEWPYHEDLADIVLTCDWGPSCRGTWPVVELEEVSGVLGMFTVRLRPA